VVHIGEWIGDRIRYLTAKLDNELFMLEGERARVKAELSTLLNQRDRYNEHQRRMAEDERLMFKDPVSK
jgi:hypothetical protein